MEIVSFPFKEQFRELMLADIKIVTSRTKRYGNEGDTFTAFGQKFILTAVGKRSICTVANDLCAHEGFDSPKAFWDCWKQIHPRKEWTASDEVWVHFFKRVISPEKITIIGSTQYQTKFTEHKKELEAQGHRVTIPAFDSHPDLDELGVCEFNRQAIENADEVHVIWDQRSTGTIFDFGMCFALRKPIKIVYLEPKTFRGVMEKYAETFSTNVEKREESK